MAQDLISMGRRDALMIIVILQPRCRTIPVEASQLLAYLLNLFAR